MRKKGGLVATLWPHEIIENESKSKIMCKLVKMVQCPIAVTVG